MHFTLLLCKLINYGITREVCCAQLVIRLPTTLLIPFPQELWLNEFKRPSKAFNELMSPPARHGNFIRRILKETSLFDINELEIIKVSVLTYTKRTIETEPLRLSAFIPTFSNLNL